MVATRAIVGALGALAALVGGVSLFFGLLGTWIS
jgi:hypothetical protein